MHPRLHTGGTGWRVSPVTLLVIAALHLIVACAVLAEAVQDDTPHPQEIAAQ